MLAMLEISAYNYPSLTRYGIGETKRYIIIGPGTKYFESRNPGALFIALSIAKTADGEYSDFAWHPDVLVNEDCFCHRANTPITKAGHQNSSFLTKQRKPPKCSSVIMYMT